MKELHSDIFCDKLTIISDEFIANLACQHMYHLEIDNTQLLIPRDQWLKAWLAIYDMVGKMQLKQLHFTDRNY